MNYIQKASMVCLTILCIQNSFAQNNAPAPVYPIPEAKQVEWQKMETYAFLHFGLNTFTDREWGTGNLSPSIFNPTKLDCEQWAKTLIAAGMKGAIITAKHHDGFCLWPTTYTDYSVRNAEWRVGRGDVLKEFTEAFRKYGLKCAFYLSPWDRHQAFYGTPLYVKFFHAQLEELLTKYGDVFEVWFDGANGGDGWYGGANESRTIDRKTYYDLPEITRIVERTQPKAIIFSDGGPGCRWVGNEGGNAGATNWSFLRKGVVYPGYMNYDELTIGHADGTQWTPAECDVSIRPGWFYHANQDKKVKTPEQLVNIYYHSVGHNATMLLNFPVTPDGLIHPIDSANSVNFHKALVKQFANNLLSGCLAALSSERGNNFSARAITDGNYDTYWATPDGVTSGTATFLLKGHRKMNCVLLQEYIPLGQRVKSFVIEYKDGENWHPVTVNEECTTVGYKRLVRFKTITSNGLRVRFLDARGPLCINNIEAYYTGESTLTFDTPLSALKSIKFNLKGRSYKDRNLVTDRDSSTVLRAEGDSIVMVFPQVMQVSQLSYLPTQQMPGEGVAYHYIISDKGKIIKEGNFDNIENNPVLQTVHFTPFRTLSLTFRVTRLVRDKGPLGIAEIAVR